MADNPFSLTNRVAIITGGCGVLGGAIANRLAAAGATVAIRDGSRECAEEKADEIRAAGGKAAALAGDVLDQDPVVKARDELLRSHKRVDILVNAGGGNVDRARNDDRPVFDVPLDAFDEVLRLNLNGTLIPCLVFGEAMSRRRAGSIVSEQNRAVLLNPNGSPTERTRTILAHTPMGPHGHVDPRLIMAVGARLFRGVRI